MVATEDYDGSMLPLAMPPYRNLNAWRHAQRLAVECAKLARGFPPYEQEALADELRRSSYRVPISIADGIARKGTGSSRPSFDNARAALAEVETILEIGRDLGYIDATTYGRVESVATEASKTLYGFLRKMPEAPAS
jgi:four helix bundle protein